MHLGRIFSLQRANYYVFTAPLPPASLVKHLKGFAHTGGVPEKYFQPPTVLPALFVFQPLEELLGGWSLRDIGHALNIIELLSKLSDLNKTLTKQRPEGYLPSVAVRVRSVFWRYDFGGNFANIYFPLPEAAGETCV